MNEAKALVDACMTGRAFVTAGPHESASREEKPFQRQDGSSAARQPKSTIGGLARLTVVEGPHDERRHCRQAASGFVCRPACTRLRRGKPGVFGR
jgi:hypothetical protein